MMDRLSKDDILLLRNLAEQVQEIAADSKWAHIEELWTKKNALEKTRPLVMCSPQGGWDEIIPPSTCKIKDKLFGWYEMNMKRLIYRSKNFRDDEVITNKIYVPYVKTVTDWIERKERPFVVDPHLAGTFHPVIEKTSDLSKMRFPEIILDEEKSEEDYQLAKEVFGDYLDVIQGEPFCSMEDGDIIGWGTSLIDVWCELRGMDAVFFDMVDEPEFTKEAMQFLMEGTIKYLKDGEQLGIWLLNNNGFVKDSNTPCGSNGLGYSDQLPQPDYNGKARLIDMWGYTMAQEFTTVSPDMLAEFVLPYHKKIADLFGLLCYGCCESNDGKWDIIMNTFSNLRELSVSPFSNFNLAVERIQDKYVLSWKPNPTDMLAAYDPEKIRREMKEAMEIAKDCHLTITLREIQTVYNEPERAKNWVDITMELAQQYE